MWVKFKKTYTGAAGMFVAGNKYDLLDAAKIPKDYYETCPAPWDERKDGELAELNALLREQAIHSSKAQTLSESAKAADARRKASKKEFEDLSNRAALARQAAEKLEPKIKELAKKVEAKKKVAAEAKAAEAQAAGETAAKEKADAGKKAADLKEMQERDKKALDARRFQK